MSIQVLLRRYARPTINDQMVNLRHLTLDDKSQVVQYNVVSPSLKW